MLAFIIHDSKPLEESLFIKFHKFQEFTCSLRSSNMAQVILTWPQHAFGKLSQYIWLWVQISKDSPRRNTYRTGTFAQPSARLCGTLTIKKSICLWPSFSSSPLPPQAFSQAEPAESTWGPVWKEADGREGGGAGSVEGSSREWRTHTHTTHLLWASGSLVCSFSLFTLFPPLCKPRKKPLEGNVRYLFTNILQCRSLLTLSAELCPSNFHHNVQSGKLASPFCTRPRGKVPCNLRLRFQMQPRVAKTQISVITSHPRF